MTKYHTTISGTRALPAIQNAIRGEEALAALFIKSQLSAVDGAITNLLTFEEQDEIPKPVKILPYGDVPAGYVLVWSGVMLVAGSNAVVSIYREP